MSGGSDASGITSTTAATASATPYATIGAAMAALRTAGSGAADGFIVRLKAGTHTATDPTYTGATYTAISAIIVECDPAATPATAILNMAANWRCDEVPHLRLRNITLSRTGNGWGIYPQNGGTVTWRAPMPMSAPSACRCSAMPARHGSTAWRSPGDDGSLLLPTVNQEFRLRGVSGTNLTMDPHAVLGSTLTNSPSPPMAWWTTAAASSAFTPSSASPGPMAA